jgi:hypothetical protein
MMLHDPTAAAALRLAAEGLALHDAPFAPPPYLRIGGSCEVAARPEELGTAKGKGACRNLNPRDDMVTAKDKGARADAPLDYRV